MTDGRQNEALDLGDFEIDDILSTPGERLLAEVGEDFGDPMFLAAEFDAIALPLLSGGAADRVQAASAAAVAQADAGVASPPARPAALPSVPSSFRHAVSEVAKRFAGPLRSRAVLGAFATLLLLAVLAPGVYPLVVRRISAEWPAAPSQYDLPARPAPMPQSAPSLSRLKIQAPADAEQQHSFAAPASPPPAVPSEPAPSLAIRGNSLRTKREQAAAPAPSARQVPRLGEISAPSQDAKPAAATPPIVGREGEGVLPPSPHKGGFVVQLSIWSSEAQARSSLRTLKSKYAVLNGHEPLIKRTDQGPRGASYAVEVGPFESWEEAEQLCAILKVSGEACSVR